MARTLPEQIASAIRRAILTGRLAPGSRLVETRIAGQVGTSRGPVRDALGLLEREGLVVKLPNRGAFVLKFTERDMREAASLRALLEEFAVNLAVHRAADSDLDRLGGLVRDMGVAARRQARRAFNDLDYRFHVAVVETSGHRTLQETWRGIERPIRAFLASTNFANSDLREVARRHEAIFRGLASRRVAEARRAIRTHFAQLQEELELVLRGNGVGGPAAQARPSRCGRH